MNMLLPSLLKTGDTQEGAKEKEKIAQIGPGEDGDNRQQPTNPIPGDD